MRIFKQSCLECKHCYKYYKPTNDEYYGFMCNKKNFCFDYNLKTAITGALCGHFNKKEVKEDDHN